MPQKRTVLSSLSTLAQDNKNVPKTLPPGSKKLDTKSKSSFPQTKEKRR